MRVFIFSFYLGMIFFSSLSVFFLPDALANRCQKKLLNSTDQMIVYLKELVEQQFVGEKQLIRFLAGLENRKIINPFSIEEVQSNASLYIHREGFEEYLNASDFNFERLIAWVKEIQKEKSRVHVKRDEARVETEHVYKKIEFHFVPSPHPFEVQVSLVTQKQWVELMGNNPSDFKNREYATTLLIHGKLHLMQPDNPVESISWWSALEFANKLSESRGLKPAYTDVNVESGQYKINSIDGDIYKTEGYRLPTEAEYASLLYDFKKILTEELKDYIWYEKNSNYETHPVGSTLKSFIINGRAIDDLLGNVIIWTQDESTEGNDKPNFFRILRGASYISEEEDLFFTTSVSFHSTLTGNGAGIRLVRSILK